MVVVGGSSGCVCAEVSELSDADVPGVGERCEAGVFFYFEECLCDDGGRGLVERQAGCGGV